MSTPEQQELLRMVALSEQVNSFLGTGVGKYLVERAAQEREDALEQLAQVDAADANRIRELQQTVKRSDSIANWLAEAYDQGLAAEDILHQQEQE